ncbi:hypothetical protein Tco_0658606 [Tanacetum coccineum]
MNRGLQTRISSHLRIYQHRITRSDDHELPDSLDARGPIHGGRSSGPTLSRLRPEHTDDEIVAEDQPDAEDTSPTAQSPDYVPESDPEADPEEDDDEDPKEDPIDYPADGGDDGDDEEGSSEDDEGDDMDIKADDEEEEHPAPAESVVVALPAADQAPSAEETESFETDESVATPPPHPAYRVTARISILAPVPALVWSNAEVSRLLAISTPPSSPLSPWSSPFPQIPSPPLPLIPSPSLPLSPPSPVIPPTLCPYQVPTSSPPLLLPSASHREDRPEVTLPPRKRLGIALGPRYEVGESSSAAAARPAGGLRADYGFVATIDREIRRDPERELLAGRLNMLFRDRRAHAYTHHQMETGARLSREAWRRSMDASDLACGEVMSLRTTVLGQMSEIRELYAADRRRQAVTSKMLKADHRRSAEMRELRTADPLQGQVTALQGQQGPVGGPAQPELPEEAGSSS